MKKVAIIGCGFSGTMSAVHLIKNATQSFELILIDKRKFFNKGIAYNPNSKNNLLNVTTVKMSAFQDQPYHFLDWLITLPQFHSFDRETVANTFVPRYFYGHYLEEIWFKTVVSKKANEPRITIIDSWVLDIESVGNDLLLVLNNDKKITVQYCIIATGNQLPENPVIINTRFIRSRRYFQNPWDVSTIVKPDDSLPVFIIGNGLTMVDTVFGLIENGFANQINTISSKGYILNPHGTSGPYISSILDELTGNLNLLAIVRIVNRHIKQAGKNGKTAGSVVDAMRPITQKLWKNLTSGEKRIFMSRLRRMWDAARHRIPEHIHEAVGKLSESGKLLQYSGRITEIYETENSLMVRFFDNKQKTIKEIAVSSVINCGGPDTDLSRSVSGFPKICILKGMFRQDDLKLGIDVNPDTYEVIDRWNRPISNILAIGPLLKGVLWETTAIRELREQTEDVAKQLMVKMAEN
jgi:uncharacterized NAD(P)/FAD-binding protein YdhS